MFLNQYFVAVNTLHVSDFTQNCIRNIENIHYFLQEYKNAPKRPFISIRKFYMNFVDFQTVHMDPR